MDTDSKGKSNNGVMANGFKSKQEGLARNLQQHQLWGRLRRALNFGGSGLEIPGTFPLNQCTKEQNRLWSRKYF